MICSTLTSETPRARKAAAAVCTIRSRVRSLWFAGQGTVYDLLLTIPIIGFFWDSLDSSHEAVCKIEAENIIYIIFSDGSHKWSLICFRRYSPAARLC